MQFQSYMIQRTNNHSVWYITKYVIPISHKGNGSRAHYIMQELADLGYDCCIITSDSNHLGKIKSLNEDYLLEIIGKVQFYWIKTIKYSTSKSIKRVLSWLHFEWKLLLLDINNLPKPDAIVVSSPSILTIINGFRLRRKFKCRLIFEIRDIWPLTIVEEGGFSRWNPFVIGLAFIEKLGYQYSDAIVGTMPNLGEHVKNILGRPKETFCIPMGISLKDMNNFSELSDVYIQEYFPKGKFIIGYAGTIGITNALEIFFECAEFMQHKKNLHFVVIGDGDLKESFQERYSHLSNLTFVHKVPRDILQSALSECDLFYLSVYPSKVWQYGQSLNKIIDYMFVGKPIIASYSGYPSMINEAKCGNFVSAGNLSSIISKIDYFEKMDPMERNNLGKRGHDWLINNRTYDKLAKRYIPILFP